MCPVMLCTEGQFVIPVRLTNTSVSSSQSGSKSSCHPIPCLAPTLLSRSPSFPLSLFTSDSSLSLSLSLNLPLCPSLHPSLLPSLGLGRKIGPAHRRPLTTNTPVPKACAARACNPHYPATHQPSIHTSLLDTSL